MKRQNLILFSMISVVAALGILVAFALPQQPTRIGESDLNFVQGLSNLQIA